jgi:hypothetical protein
MGVADRLDLLQAMAVDESSKRLRISLSLVTSWLAGLAATVLVKPVKSVKRTVPSW